MGKYGKNDWKIKAYYVATGIVAVGIVATLGINSPKIIVKVKTALEQNDTSSDAGQISDSKDTSEESTSVSESVADDSKADTTSESTGDDSDSSAVLSKYDSIADYVNSDLVQNQISRVKESLAESGMEMEVTGEDNKLIYTYAYSELTQVDGMADALASGLDAQADTFKSVAKSLKVAVDEENPVVVVRYVDANGDEIYSQEFTAE